MDLLEAFQQRSRRRFRHAYNDASSREKENFMGKYFLAWICGVPAFVLVLVYLFVH